MLAELEIIKTLMIKKQHSLKNCSHVVRESRQLRTCGCLNRLA